MEEYEKTELGRKISTLYSDISPAYYEKHGFQFCPSFESQTNLEVIQIPQDDILFSLIEFDKMKQKDEMKTIYSTFHNQFLFSIVRGDDYWEMILEKFPEDRYFWLINSRDEKAGYVRLKLTGKNIRITDYALNQCDEILLSGMYSSLLAYAKESQYKQFTGWIPDCDITQKLFHIVPRETEITMIKSLDQTVVFNQDAINATNFFAEVDHV